MGNQNGRILHWLETHDGLTQLEAFNALGVCRLSERCREIEKAGVLIDHEPEKTPGQARVIRYKLQRIPYG